VPTFIQAYDDLLGGGVPPGHVVLLSGGAGTMKSSLAYSILHENARRGGAGLYVTVEQDAHSLLAQLRSMGFPVEATAKALPVLDLSRGREYLERLPSRAGGTVSPVKAVQQNIEELRKERGLTLLAIDSWDALELVLDFEDPRVETFEFFRWLRSLGVTSFLVTERGPQGSSQRFGDEFLADAVFHLRLDRTAALQYQRRIQCEKFRSSDHSADLLTLVFDGGQFEVVRAIG
jgi:circadian clock protein KaiC